MSSVPIGPDFLVNTAKGEQQLAPSIAVDSQGDSIVVWESNDTTGVLQIFGQRYDGAGIAQGGEFLVNQAPLLARVVPKVAMDATGNFVVTWESRDQDGSRGGIYARRFDAAAVPQSNEFQVNTFTPGEQRVPSIAMDPAGDFVIAWQSFLQEDGYGIYAQRYNPAGVAQGGEFRVNTTTAGDQIAPSVAMDASGDFVVAWQSANQAGPATGFDIVAQRFSATGVPQGGEILANTATAGDQANASVAMDPAGNFVVAWQGPDASGDGVFARGFNAGGVPLSTPEFPVNATTTGDQGVPCVTMSSTAQVIIVWQGPGGDGLEIFAREFAASGVPAGGEFQVNTTTYNDQLKPQVAINASGWLAFTWETYDSPLNIPGDRQDSDIRARFFSDPLADPKIDLTKFVNGNDANSAPGVSVAVGSTVTFTYEVKNTGNVPLTITSLVDDNGTPANPADDFSPSPVLAGGFNVGDTNTNGKLDLTETWKYTASAIAQAGQYTNTAKVTGKDSNNTTVTDTDPGNYFGNAPKGSISGTKFNDLTGNSLTADDTPMGGFTIQLFQDKNNNNVLDAGDGAPFATKVSATTGAIGTYSFQNLAAGRYFVQEVVPAGWVRTEPMSATVGYYTINLAAGINVVDKDFANTEKCDLDCLSSIRYYVNGCQVSDLRGNTDECDTVKVVFTVKKGCTETVSLVSYTAPGSSFDANTASQQVVYDMDTKTFGPGTYSLEVKIPKGFYQVDFVCGGVIDKFGPAGSNIFYTPQGRLFSADNGGSSASTGYKLGTGDTETVSFWANNSTGQALIKSLNGGSSATKLGTWLASNFPGLYSGLAGDSNSDVAAYFKSLKSQSSDMTEAQVMALALSVYVTDFDLAGAVANAYGFNVSYGGTGQKKYNVGTNGSVLSGLSSSTSYSVMDILDAANDTADSNKKFYVTSSTKRAKLTSIFNTMNAIG